jgi:F1F0 ATPase subunit 2
MAGPESGFVAGMAIAGVAGAAVGLAHFAGLWLTVRSLATARRPGLVVAASAMARLLVTAGALAWLAQAGGWRWVVAALVGFVGARQAVVRRWGRVPEPAP